MKRDLINWYKIAQNNQIINKIASIAQSVRSSLSSADDDDLKEYCLPASRALSKKLNEAGIRSIVVQGVFKVDSPDPESYAEWNINDFESEEEMHEATFTPLHYWVEVLMSPNEKNNLIVDITASQFNDEIDTPQNTIEIDTYNNMPRYMPIQKDWI